MMRRPFYFFFFLCYTASIFSDTAYVVNSGDTPSTISIIDTTSNMVIHTITGPVGSVFTRIAVTPNGAQVWAANNNGSVEVYDTTSFMNLASISIGNNPRPMAISPDGSIAYVGQFGAALVTPIDTATYMTGPNIAVGSSPSYIVFSPDGAFAYVTNRFSDSISRIRTSDNSVVTPFSTLGVGDAPNNGMTITPDGAFLYVGTAMNSILQIRTSDGVIQNSFAVPNAGNPRSLAITSDGAYIYATDSSNNDVHVFSTASQAFVPPPHRCWHESRL